MEINHRASDAQRKAIDDLRDRLGYSFKTICLFVSLFHQKPYYNLNADDCELNMEEAYEFFAFLYDNNNDKNREVIGIRLDSLEQENPGMVAEFERFWAQEQSIPKGTSYDMAKAKSFIDFEQIANNFVSTRKKMDKRSNWSQEEEFLLVVTALRQNLNMPMAVAASLVPELRKLNPGHVLKPNGAAVFTQWRTMHDSLRRFMGLQGIMIGQVNHTNNPSADTLSAEQADLFSYTGVGASEASGKSVEPAKDTREIQTLNPVVNDTVPKSTTEIENKSLSIGASVDKLLREKDDQLAKANEALERERRLRLDIEEKFNALQKSSQQAMFEQASTRLMASLDEDLKTIWQLVKNRIKTEMDTEKQGSQTESVA